VPRSTTRPAYITSTRSATSATTPMSCVTSTTASCSSFNRTEPRTDRPLLDVQAYHPATGGEERLSQIAEVTLRNAARIVGVDPGTVPPDPAGAKTFMEAMFFENGRFRIPTRIR